MHECAKTIMAVATSDQWLRTTDNNGRQNRHQTASTEKLSVTAVSTNYCNDQCDITTNCDLTKLKCINKSDWQLLFAHHHHSKSFDWTHHTWFKWGASDHYLVVVSKCLFRQSEVDFLLSGHHHQLVHNLSATSLLQLYKNTHANQTIPQLTDVSYEN